MIRFLFSAFVVATLLVPGSAAEPPPLPAQEIVDRAVTRTQTAHDKNVPRKIVYQKKSLTEKLNSKGRVTDREEKLYSVTLQSNRVFLRLLKIDGKTPTAAQMKQEGQEIADARSHEEPKSPRGEERTLYLTADMVKKYDYQLKPSVRVRGRPCYVLYFRPKKGLTSKGIMDRAMNQLSGVLWIDTVEFEIARAEVHLLSPVTLWGGVLGALKRFDYRLERTRVLEDLWFNQSSAGNLEFRKLFSSDHIRTQSEWSGVKVEGEQIENRK